jgi:hypothetical protein
VDSEEPLQPVTPELELAGQIVVIETPPGPVLVVFAHLFE